MSRTSRLLTGVALTLAMLVAGATNAAASEWPLQAYWPFLEAKGQTIYDISGRGNHGKFGRLPGADPRDPEWIRGLFGVGSALRLDGNDFVAIPDTDTLRPKRVTIEAWVRDKGSPGQWKYIG